MTSASNSQLQLSVSSFHQGLKLAWMIAHQADSGTIRPVHLAEALHLRPAEVAELAMGLAGMVVSEIEPKQ